MTPEQAETLLLTLKAAFPHSDNGIDRLKVKARDGLYRQAFSKWHFKPAEEAVADVIRASRFFPTVAELHSAYVDALAPHRERQRVDNALPAPGHTTASPEEIRAACAAAISTVEANAVVPPHPKPPRERTPDQVLRELEGAKGRATPPELDRKTVATGDT